MTEQITTPVKHIERLNDIARNFEEEGFVTTVEYIAQQVELAYIAGQNAYRAGDFRNEVRDTGEVKVAAVNYTKFKGFRL